MIYPECKKPTPDNFHEIDDKIRELVESFRLMSMGKQAVDVIVDRLNLEPFYEFLTTFNTGNDLPYHNLYHAHCMLLNCYEAAWHLGVPEGETRGLCVAALLHDFNHSGGHKPDSENIKAALEGLKIAQTYASSRLLGLDRFALEIASTSISVTQYPFIHEPTSLTQQIIRDADLMQAYEESEFRIVQQFLGLKSEIEIAKKTTFTNAEFAAGMKKFQDAETVWYTRWAQKKADTVGWEFAKYNLQQLLIAA